MSKHFRSGCFISILLLYLCTPVLVAQKYSNISIGPDSLRIPLDSGWIFKNGDQQDRANKVLNDSDWLPVNTNNPENFSGIGWFRYHFKISDSADLEAVGLFMEHNGASEIYLDGRLIGNFGTVSAEPEKEKRSTPKDIPVAINIIPGKEHLLAVRYSNHEVKNSDDGDGKNLPGFRCSLGNCNEAINAKVSTVFNTSFFTLPLFGFFLALGLAHLLLFFYYRARRSNLYYFLFMAIFSGFPLSAFLEINVTSSVASDFIQLFMAFTFPLFFLSYVALTYSLFYTRFPKLIYVALGLTLITIVSLFAYREALVPAVILLILFASIESIRVIIVALKKKKDGARIMGTGVLFFAGFVIAIFVVGIIKQGEFTFSGAAGLVVLVFLFCALLSIPVSMSVFLARDFARTNRDLTAKLAEVKELSDKTIEQEKEKQRILETQKETLEVQVNERTSQISEQKKIIEEKNKDITDSINYAKRIQESILPTGEHIKSMFSESFVLFKPKDIVSGDFFWFGESNGVRIAVAADCTGHGVPGALMSMIGSNILHQLIMEQRITDPGTILTQLHLRVTGALKQRSDGSRDGMDIALTAIDKTGKISFAGAQRPLWIVKEGEDLREIKGDKFPIGGSFEESNRAFLTHSFQLEKGSTLYMSSDGYADQFGGETSPGTGGKKFMTRRLKEILSTFHSLAMNDQSAKLEATLIKWMGDKEQVDDVLIIGLRP